MDTVFWILLFLFLTGGIGFKYSSGKTRLRLGSADDEDDDVEYDAEYFRASDDEEDETEDAEEVLENQHNLEILSGRFEAAGFRVLKPEDGDEKGELGCLKFELTHRWSCGHCEERRHLYEVYEYAMVRPPTAQAPMAAEWKRLGWLCIHCGNFSRTKRCFAGGILGELLPNSGNIREMFVALRESDTDVNARIKAIIDAQKEFWRRRLEAAERSNQKLLAPLSGRSRKKTG